MLSAEPKLCKLCSRPPNPLHRDCPQCVNWHEEEDDKSSTNNLGSLIIQSLSQSLTSLKNHVDLGGQASKIFSRKTDDSEDRQSDIDDYIDDTCEEYSACYSGSPISPSYPQVVNPSYHIPTIQNKLLCLPPSTNSVSVQTTQQDLSENIYSENIGYLYRLEPPFYLEENLQTSRENKQVSINKFSTYNNSTRASTPDKGSQASSLKTTPIKGETNQPDNTKPTEHLDISYPLKIAFIILLIIFGGLLIMEHVENKRNELVEKKMEEILECKIHYEKNWCHKEDSIIPEQCERWRKCKDSDPRAKVSNFKAITSGIADTINSFFEELSPKATISLFIILM